MRAVNLLPEKHRPRQATGGKSGSSYFLVGALGLVVVGVLLYVLTLNSINSAKTDIAEAQAATAQANSQADQLGVYGDFAKVKEQRWAAVKDLASGRTDWERVVRELATVLPEGVWIQSASAADAGADATGAASSTGAAPAPATPGATTTSSTGGPTLTLDGCARDQAQVAETLVRLRQMQGAADVQLEHSSKPDQVAAPTDSAGSTGDCGTSDGAANYDFSASVSFTKVDTSDDGRVPTRLGGGE